MLGNAFHPEDMLHAYGKQEHLKYFRYPCVRLDGMAVWPDKRPCLLLHVGVMRRASRVTGWSGSWGRANM